MLTLDFSNFPILRTERLVLRPMTQEDAPALFELRTDPVINRYIDRLPTTELEDALRFIEKIDKGIRDNRWLYWAITETTHKEDLDREDPEGQEILKDHEVQQGQEVLPDRLIGTICLWNFVPTDDKAELGYELSAARQGRGLMGEAVEVVLAYGFGTIGLSAVEAAVHPENAASVKVLKRDGFTLVGTFEDTTLTGETAEMLIYEKRR
jgi:[ribosomal protein S5]-alanine N-acetyltransferase